jgi:hypothetical protein
VNLKREDMAGIGKEVACSIAINYSDNFPRGNKEYH